MVRQQDWHYQHAQAHVQQVWIILDLNDTQDIMEGQVVWLQAVVQDHVHQEVIHHLVQLCAHHVQQVIWLTLFNNINSKDIMVRQQLWQQAHALGHVQQVWKVENKLYTGYYGGTSGLTSSSCSGSCSAGYLIDFI